MIVMDKIFSGILLIIVGLLIFNFVQFNIHVKEERELSDLREVSYEISSNYTNLQEKKDMSCFINYEFEVEQKKVKLFLDQDMTVATCGEQIVQFNHFAMKSPFTLEIIEYP